MRIENLDDLKKIIFNTDKFCLNEWKWWPNNFYYIFVGTHKWRAWTWWMKEQHQGWLFFEWGWLHWSEEKLRDWMVINFGRLCR